MTHGRVVTEMAVSLGSGKLAASPCAVTLRKWVNVGYEVEPGRFIRLEAWIPNGDHRNGLVTSHEAWFRFLCRINSVTSGRQKKKLRRLLSENVFSFDDEYFRKKIGEQRGTKSVGRQTLSDWCHRGIRARGKVLKLEYARVGKKYVTSLSAITRLFARQADILFYG